MNFKTLNVDLQAVAQRAYMSLYYKSTFMNFLNTSYMQTNRSTPIIEIIKTVATAVNERETTEIMNPLTPELATYNPAFVNLTELAMDYSFRVSPVITNSAVMGVIEDQIKLKDSALSKKIDVYGYKKLNTRINGASDGSMAYTNGQCKVWAPANKEAYIDIVNELKAILFDRDVYDGYMLGLESIEYAKMVSALTAIIKYETRTGVEAIDRGTFAYAYGVDIFQINSKVLEGNVKGYFGNEIAAVGDLYFTAMSEFPGNYPGYPGYYVLEGNILFGAEVVRPEAMIKLVDSLPTMGTYTIPQLTNGTAMAAVTPTGGSGVVKYSAAGLPAGLTINETSGQVSGTPTVTGTFEVSIFGADANGNYGVPYNGTITVVAGD